VIPREGVERHECACAWLMIELKVIPREGVERHECACAWLMIELKVIPREGVESAQFKLDEVWLVFLE